MNKVQTRIYLSQARLTLILGALALGISCDDRTPTAPPSSQDIPIYTLYVWHQFMAEDSVLGAVAVGEDLKGNDTYTRLITRLLDKDNDPVAGKTINFQARVGSQSFGSFTYIGESVTDEDGLVQVNFFDNGTAASDNPGTPTFEGVTLTAGYEQIGYPGNPDTTITVRATVQYNIIDPVATPVWPYRIILSSDTEVIGVDNGATKATFTARIINKLNMPLQNLLLYFTISPDSLGILNLSSAVTDSSGAVTVELSDTGDPAYVGNVNFTTRYQHPLYGPVYKSKQVSIIEEATTGYSIALTAQPVVGPYNNPVIVGEDVSDYAVGSSSVVRTQVTALVRDAGGSPLSGKVVNFYAIFGSDTSYSSFNVNYAATNASGYAVANFLDGDQYAEDNPVTPNYEGVTVVAYIEEVFSTTRFNVYRYVADVWPYRLNLYRDTDAIYLDNGLTKAEITAVLSNRRNRPLRNVDIAFTVDRGFVDDFEITDSTGTASVFFTDLGDPGDVGISTIVATYIHPSFGSVTDTVQVSIIDPSSSNIPAYITIPASYPGDIMVTGGGGLESTNICANVYDENGQLVNIPTAVTFQLGPASPAGVRFGNGTAIQTANTSNGKACVSLNAGTQPGPVYIIATVNDTITATAIPVIVVTGPAYNIFPDVDPNSITPIGGGFYQMEAAALVHDLHGNPVADSTYVYWSLSVSPGDADSVLDAQIVGVSFTHNENLNGNQYKGMAFTTIIYPSHGIFDVGRVRAYTYGAGGAIVLDSVENDVNLPYYGDQLILTSNIVFWDFTTMGSTATVVLTATLMDYYGNPVENGTIRFYAPGGTFLTTNPITNGNGQAFAMVEYQQSICPPIPGSDPVLYEDFTSTCSAILLDPLGATSDPVDILFVRSYQGLR